MSSTHDWHIGAIADPDSILIACSLSKEVFDTDRGLWLATKEQELYPNPHSYAREQAQLDWYRFIGRILGKALYEGILIDVRFADFFLAKWLGRQSYCKLTNAAACMLDTGCSCGDWCLICRSG